jgi:uncharacterized membrane protein YdcZ (DUF606 family)
MTVGLCVTQFADVVLNYMTRAVAGTVPAANYVQLHTSVGEPGAAGTSNVATGSGATRVVVTFSASSSGAVAMSGTAPSWTAWSGGTVTLSYISVWSAITAGNFLYSAALTTPKAITTGDTFTLSSLSVSLAPLAA